MGRRTLLVIASLLVAAAGTALIWAYVSNADSRATARWQLVTVWQAQSNIEAGTSVATLQGQVVSQQVPSTVAPPTRVTSFRELAGKQVTVPILAGQYLIGEQFSTTGVSSGVSDDKMAVEVDLDDPNRVAGLLHPGSQIAIYWLPGATGGKTESGGGASSEARLLLSDVRVLGVGSTTSTVNGDGTAVHVGTQTGVASGVVTLEATGPQATKIMLARSTGVLWFTVLGKNVKGDTKDNTTVPALIGSNG